MASFVKCMHASEMSLNNEFLSIVLATVDEVMSIVQKAIISPVSSTPNPFMQIPSKGTLETVLGRCLAQCFFDQICQLILSSNSEARVYLLEADEKGSISKTSTVSQRVGSFNNQSNSFYIAMSINQLPSGEYKVKHVLLEWLSPGRRKRSK